LQTSQDFSYNPGPCASLLRVPQGLEELQVTRKMGIFRPRVDLVRLRNAGTGRVYGQRCVAMASNARQNAGESCRKIIQVIFM